MNNKKPMLYRFEHVGKIFQGTEENIEILKDINLEIYQGETVAIIGASGSGKSTLLHLMGALDKPSSGKIFFENQELSLLKIEEQAEFRNNKIGFVFQFHHLLPEFTAQENVAMPGLIGRQSAFKMTQLADSLLDRVGLKDRKNSKPATLSGGERQRAAIARALLMQPKALLADEPTGNLDEKNSHAVMDLLLELNRETGMTLIIVTHNPELAAKMDRVLELRSGALYEKFFA